MHSRYDRQVSDAAIAGRPVVVRLQVRRLFCDSPDSPVRTFAEQVPGLTSPYARRTPMLRGMLEAIGLALAGRAGARLARRPGLPASRETLLRLVRALPDPPAGAVTVLGAGDFAVKRGQNYATILLDMATRQPIDVLDGRDAGTLADWLSAHPEITVITRDRAGSYAEGATPGRTPGHPVRGSLAPVAVRREALFDLMEVRDRPSARCRSGGPELEAA